MELDDVLRGLPEFSGPEVMAGINQGVLQGWWWNAPMRRIRPTDAGIAADLAAHHDGRTSRTPRRNTAAPPMSPA
ncbi:hypothetical protein GXW71_10445 [Roseomonas hellenica]|uniref:Uncharacterized protein n=1 Tax=Plastoroseomonas hellenica TaxID=2687306 RepID=A0ABS5EWU5_9PROT|nr:hypothetical protein [Plastoroseomonas hellenica]MBR0664769.1 hypothetical protein [Plastoroseomonas hellenica]